jgi:hypothetical protein
LGRGADVSDLLVFAGSYGDLEGAIAALEEAEKAPALA